MQQNNRSKKQERDRAKEIGGRAQPGSGSSSRAPQDVKQKLNEQDDGVLEQLKFTMKKSITITLADIQQLQRDALRSGREPRYVVDFYKSGTSEKIVRLIITPE